MTYEDYTFIEIINEHKEYKEYYAHSVIWRILLSTYINGCKKLNQWIPMVRYHGNCMALDR